MIQIGCVADDFTGASDWASFFAEKGIKAVLFNGIPEASCCQEADVAVIALKSRTAPVRQAVEENLQALNWLKSHDTRRYYIKYCSTFDCRKEGNIGPVLDAAAELLGEQATIVCPALPVNGRTVRDGKLYVNGIELQESSMKNHPLTPMWDCRLSELMKEQSKGKIVPMSAELYTDMEKAADWIDQQIKTHQGRLVYFAPDFYVQEHGEKIVRLFQNRKLLTGGSGLCTFLADGIRHDTGKRETKMEAPAILIAGSCSQMTLKQIKTYLEAGKRAVRIDPARLLDGKDTVDRLWEELRKLPEKELLLYSSQSAPEVLENQRHGKEKVARLIEDTLAELANRFLTIGRKRIIVAGGETSGAITRKLGYKAYYVGSSIAPGVPVMMPTADTQIRLVLKSGNFGDESFFLKALKMTER